MHRMLFQESLAYLPPHTLVRDPQDDHEREAMLARADTYPPPGRPPLSPPGCTAGIWSKVFMHRLLQEALFEAGVRRLGDIDHLDPGVKGDTKASSTRNPKP